MPTNFDAVNFYKLFDMETERKQRYVDILSNAGFKAFFGDENNKEAVMELLNTLLPEHRQIKDIFYRPTEHQGPVIGHSKEFQFDFMCSDTSGAKFIVETQRYREDSWFKRCVSYASRAYDMQNKTGFDYDVPPVYLIGLMGVDINHPDREYWKDRYISEYTFREKECHDLLDETIVIIFAELTRFHKTEDECVTLQDKLLYLLKNSGKMKTPPVWGAEKPCKDILEAFEIGDFSRKTWRQFHKRSRKNNTEAGWSRMTSARFCNIVRFQILMSSWLVQKGGRQKSSGIFADRLRPKDDKVRMRSLIRFGF